MSTRTIARISVALNLALAIGIVLLIRSRSSSVKDPAAMELPAVVQSAAATTAMVSSAQIHLPAQSFRWSQILSEDLKVYRDNLRAIGCPVLTVHDIILAGINERFEQRRLNLLAGMQSRFWEFAIHGEMAFRYEWGMPMKLLARERQEMIEDVLGGPEYNPPEASAENFREMMQRHLGWLSAEKRDRLFELEQKRQKGFEDWAKSVGDRLYGTLTAEDEAGRQAVQREFDDARNALLTPAELEESRLRDSKESLWAAGLSGFEPTPEEWRTVTRLRVEAEEAEHRLDDPDLSEETRKQRAEELQDRLAQEIQTTLGPERFAQYELANDGHFQEVRKVTQRYGLPDNIAAEAFAARQAVVVQAEKVREDTSLSAEVRQAALTMLQRDTERTLARTLGDKVLATYKEYSGQWLAQLSQSGTE